MEFKFHIKNCDCDFCKNGDGTILGYAIHHAGYFSDKESALRAIDSIVKAIIEQDPEEISNVVKAWKQIREETEKFDNSDQSIWKKRGHYKK